MQTQHNVQTDPVDGCWGRLWKLKVPPKVKNFLWRLGRECLPTRAALLRRGLEVPHLCPFCGDSEENSLHLFATCHTASLCWTALGILPIISSEAAATDSFHEWFFNVLQALEGDTCCAWAMILWSIWSSRNNLVWNNVRDSAGAIVRHATSFLADWHSARGAAVSRPGVASATQPGGTVPSEWQRPPPNFVKCNIDAAFDGYGNRVGFGMCIRDELGTFVAAKTHSFAPLVDVYIGEALGLLLAIDWVRELHYHNVVFEMDAKVVVDDFNKAPRISSDYGCILNHCREAFSFFNEHSHVEFARREANKVAHTLAGAALLTAHSQSFHDVPACIAAIIINEMN